MGRLSRGQETSARGAPTRMQGLENGCAVEPAGPAAAVACAAGQGQEHDNDDQEQVG